jgi:uncharacterized repeat protein (TIGR03803 family)
VFNITPSGTVTVVYDFNDATGSGYTPFSGLTLGTDGDFYGTTKSGGTFNQGTLFKVTASGGLTSLYNFGTCKYPCKEGVYPIAPPVQGTDGNFYGTTPYTTDGTNSGVVYKITPTGKYKIIHAFDYTAGGYFPNAPLMQGVDGNFYGTTSLGGKTVTPTCVARFASSTCGTVFKITPGGKVSFIYEFDLTHGVGPIGPVTQGSDGNFYGTTSEGGTSGFGVVFKLTPTGVLTVLHDFNGTDGKTPDAGLVQANDGNFYGVASAGGTLGYGTSRRRALSRFSTTWRTPTVQLQKSPWFSTPMGFSAATPTGEIPKGAEFSTGLNIGALEFAKLQTTSGTVGSLVSILGQDFTGATAVSFGGMNATKFSVVSDNYVTAKVPAGGKTGAVTVVRPSGNLNSIQQFKVTPTVSSISPTSRPIGTVVTINGTGLTRASKVAFGSVKATTFTVNSDSQVTATVPTGAKNGKIAITTP